ncbi:MAG: hypothetical protein Q8M20_11605 [Rhodocyclaceae bacterium]|nr:hypothetical protein [Rhodocyclaceae bacterium]MDZ4215305.1 hypothetical protein [Rhodocyclaceae bacterium]
MDEPRAAGQDLAVMGESLYLINLMLAPGLAFLGIVWLWFKHRHSAPPLARCHLDQTFFVSLWGGVLIVGANAALFLIFGWDWEWTWVIVIMYFTCIHSTLIILGMVGLSKAMAGKPYVYPWIGRRCD